MLSRDETGSYSLFSNQQHRLYHQRQELNLATLLRYFSYQERNDMKIIRLSRLIITCDGINRNECVQSFHSYETIVIGCYVKGFSSVHKHVHKFPNNIRQIISFKMNLAFALSHSHLRVSCSVLLFTITYNFLVLLLQTM